MARTSEGGRLAYADLLRVLALAAAMVLVVSTAWSAPVGSADWAVLNVYGCLTRWCVPVFAMLSGAFLLEPRGDSGLPWLFFHNVFRLLAAMAVWGAGYTVAEYFVRGGALSPAGVWGALRAALLGGAPEYLWFFYVILGLYLVTPVLRAFVRGAGKRELHYFLLLAFLLASLLPTLLALRPSRAAALWLDRLDVTLVLGYVGYFVAGYYLKSVTLGRLAEFLLYLLGILGGAVTVVGTDRLSRAAGYPVDTLCAYTAPGVAAMAAAVFVFFRYVLGVSEERSRRRSLSGMSRLTMGTYLAHAFFLLPLNRLGVSVFSFSPALSVPVLSAGLLACSFAAAWLISKLPFVGRYLT